MITVNGKESRLILMEAHTDPSYQDGIVIHKKAWALGASVEKDSYIQLLDFDTQSHYLDIYLTTGVLIRKYKPITLIYYPYATAKDILNKQGRLQYVAID